MKILQIINSLGNGGAEKLVVDLSNELSKDNEVVLCTLKNDFDWEFSINRLSKKITLFKLNKKKGPDLGLYIKLYKVIRQQKPDVIHFHLDATIKYIIPFILIFHKPKYFHTIHFELDSFKKKIFNRLNLLNRVTKKVKFICISKSIFDSFNNEYPKLNFFLIENGIKQLNTTYLLNDVKSEINNYRNNDNTKVFITIGRIDDQKNHKLLLEVFHELVTENIIGIIIGDDPSPGKTLLNKLKNKNTKNIFFIGPKANVADYLDNSDAFILSSIGEGLPIVAIEAISFGLPVITTPAGGMVDIIENNINGFVSENFDKDSLKTALLNYLTATKYQISSIQKNNINKYYSKYSIEKCKESHLKIFK